MFTYDRTPICYAIKYQLRPMARRKTLSNLSPHLYPILIPTSLPSSSPSFLSFFFLAFFLIFFFSRTTLIKNFMNVVYRIYLHSLLYDERESLRTFFRGCTRKKNEGSIIILFLWPFRECDFKKVEGLKKKKRKKRENSQEPLLLSNILLTETIRNLLVETQP